MRLWSVLPIVIVLALGSCTQNDASPPSAISTEAEAVAAAKGAFRGVSSKLARPSVFDEANVRRFEPYSATLKDGVWHVVGTRRAGQAGGIPEAFVTTQGDIRVREDGTPDQR